MRAGGVIIRHNTIRTDHRPTENTLTEEAVVAEARIRTIMDDTIDVTTNNITATNSVEAVGIIPTRGTAQPRTCLDPT